MHTACLLTVSQHEWLGGITAKGVYLPGVCTCWGCVPAGGVPAQVLPLQGVKFLFFPIFLSILLFFLFFLAISSYFSYFLAILLIISKYLLEIWTS